MTAAPNVAEKTVLERILDWSEDRPLWQRDALCRIVAQGALNPPAIKELVELCKAGRGANGIALKAVPLDKSHMAANPAQSHAVSLLAISAVTGVNNLAPDQTLAFAPKGITIVYGDNGAGKIGYARILKRACRARHAGKIEPNVYELTPPAASATLTYAVGGGAQPPDAWEDADTPHPILSAVSVFDSECATVHLSDKNEVAFRPFGLDIPDELAHVCQQVKEALTAEQKFLQNARNPVFVKPPWKAGGVVAASLAQLRSDTDLEKLKTLGTLAPGEVARLARLREDLAKDPARAAAQQRLKAEHVKRIADAVAAVMASTADDRLRSVFTVERDARAKRAAAEVAAERAFAREPLQGVGSDVWRVLLEAARRYSVDVAYPGIPFPLPTADAQCLLCQQPMTADASARLARFEDFIRADTERQAKLAEAAAATVRRDLAAVAISTRALKASLQEVALHDPDLVLRVRRTIAAARLRRWHLHASLGNDHLAQLPESRPTHSATSQRAKPAFAPTRWNCSKRPSVMPVKSSPRSATHWLIVRSSVGLWRSSRTKLRYSIRFSFWNNALRIL